MGRKKILVSWSSGKDGAWALHLLRQSQQYEIVGLLTTLSARDDRIAMHGVRRELLEAQAEAAGLPLWSVTIPWPCPNEAYESILGREMANAKDRGIVGVAFGDLFLAEIRAYRESKLSGTGIEPIFPLWGMPTKALAREMIAAGCARGSSASTRSSWRRDSRDASSTRRCWRSCRLRSIRAASAASSTRIVGMGRCSRGRSPCARAAIEESEGYARVDVTLAGR